MINPELLKRVNQQRANQLIHEAEQSSMLRQAQKTELTIGQFGLQRSLRLSGSTKSYLLRIFNSIIQRSPKSDPVQSLDLSELPKSNS